VTISNNILNFFYFFNSNFIFNVLLPLFNVTFEMCEKRKKSVEVIERKSKLFVSLIILGLLKSEDFKTHTYILFFLILIIHQIYFYLSLMLCLERMKGGRKNEKVTKKKLDCSSLVAIF